MWPPSDSPPSTPESSCWLFPRIQTTAGCLCRAQRRAAPSTGSHGGRPGPTEPPANRRARLKPLCGKTAGRSAATEREARQGGSGRGDNDEDFLTWRAKLNFFCIHLIYLNLLCLLVAKNALCTSSRSAVSPGFCCCSVWACPAAVTSCHLLPVNYLREPAGRHKTLTSPPSHTSSPQMGNQNHIYSTEPTSSHPDCFYDHTGRNREQDFSDMTCLGWRDGWLGFLTLSEFRRQMRKSAFKNDKVCFLTARKYFEIMVILKQSLDTILIPVTSTKHKSCCIISTFVKQVSIE